MREVCRLRAQSGLPGEAGPDIGRAHRVQQDAVRLARADEDFPQRDGNCVAATAA